MSDPVPPFCSYRRYLTDLYGEPLYRVPVDAGWGCPNRNADGTGGCTFCPPDGSRSEVTARARTVEEQISAAMDFARRRYGARRFMLYVQAFTGTFAGVAEQKAQYERMLALFPFDALSIGTRPDCLSGETLDLLVSFQKRVDVWVELGLQTVHERTLEKIRRGHTWEAGRRALLNLRTRGLKAIAHVILGLPGENRTDFSATADTLGGLPMNAVKIHNLHVIRGTDLAREYQDSPFPVYDEEVYAEILIDFLRRLPPRLPIVRINTGTPPERLTAPRWAMSKAGFRAFVERRMIESGVRQGDLFGQREEKVSGVRCQDG